MDDFTPDFGSQSEDGLIAPPDAVGDATGWSVVGDTEGAAGADPHDNLWWFSDGNLWDLGPAEIDTDGDGRPDALTSELDGQTAVLTDTDGDGRVDRMSVLRSDGRVAAWEVRERDEDWSPTTLGRLD